MNFSVSIYECNACGYVGDYDSFLADPYVGEVFCPCEGCTGAGKWLKDREARFVGIAAYICDRAYGGDRTYRVRTWIEKVPPMGFPSRKPVYC